MKHLALSLLLLSTAASAQIYKSVDAQGNVTYSNYPIRGGKAVQLDPLSTYEPGANRSRSAPAPSNKGSDSKPANAAPVAATPGYPNVSSGTQQQRDQGRRQILQDELNNEQKALADARKALAEGQAVRNGNEQNYQKYLDRVQKLKDAVTDREKNVQALQRELSQVR